MFYRIFLIFVFFLVFVTAASAQQKRLQIDFAEKEQVILHGSAGLNKKILVLDGKNSFANIKNSSGVHVGNGMTLTATVKFKDGAAVRNRADSYDMIFSKKNEFIFGRNMKKLYVNLHDGKKWCAPAIGGNAPQPGSWNHLAAVIERFSDEAQGKKGYEIRIYVNGQPVVEKKFFNIEPQTTENGVNIGSGFGGGPWFFHGEIANAGIYDRALTEAEILDLVKKDQHISPVLKGQTNVPGRLQNIVSSVSKSGMPGARWSIRALHAMSVNGGDPAKIIAAAKKIESYKNEPMEAFVRKFNRSQKEFHILLNRDLAAMFMLGKGKFVHPVAGVMNRKTGKEIFGKKAMTWSLEWRAHGKTHVLKHNSSDISWFSRLHDKNTLEISWRASGPFPVRAKSLITFAGPRMEDTFEVTNLSAAKQLLSVSYPEYSFAKLSGKKDKMVYPWMSGVEVENPTRKRFRFGQKGYYPSGSVTFQFGAYYDEHSGIYFGMEDGKGLSKYYEVVGRNQSLDIVWKHPVPLAAGKQGGNSFRLSGRSVIELYRGDWFEAGMIYRRFLERSAAWWIKDLPRKSTPEWYRNCTLWMILTVPARQMAEDAHDVSAYLRRYFELPFGVHWYLWNDKSKGNYPHFHPYDFVFPINNKIRKNGIYTMPYFNSRLWSLTDGPNNTDAEYSTKGAKYAAKGIDGKPQLEYYGRKAVYAVMCPAVKDWQNTLNKEVKKLADAGFQALYHDQVGTGRPILCFDPTHGHALNDPAAWVKNGYAPMFRRFFKTLSKDHPEFCHSTEENAEPYLNLFDGYMIWRCTDAPQIPLFQSIYSGRIQFVGRLFNHVRPGDKQSFFSKVGQQLVNAEQLGWFPIFELYDNDARRLFVKKAMHVRLALLPWFNSGKRLRSLDFQGTMPEDRSLWGGMVPQIVTMPQIANSAWIDSKGNKMWLFVNTQQKKVKTMPAFHSAKQVWRCQEGKSQPVLKGRDASIELEKLSFEVWVEGDRKLAEQVQKTLKKIAGFDPGKPIRAFIPMKSGKYAGIPGKFYSVREIARSVGCIPKSDHFAWIQDGANIIFGEIDFGSTPVRSLTLNMAIVSEKKDNLIEIYAISGKKEEKIAVVQPKKTGTPKDFKEVEISLAKPIRGKCKLVFQFRGSGFCYFAGWKFNR